MPENDDVLANAILIAGMCAAVLLVLGSDRDQRPNFLMAWDLLAETAASSSIAFQAALLGAGLLSVSNFRILGFALCIAGASGLLAFIIFAGQRGPELAMGAVSPALEETVSALNRLLSSTRRHAGIELRHASDSGPLVEVRHDRGRVVRIVIRRGFGQVLCDVRRKFGGACERSVCRFILLHEVGHVLNGDHLTFVQARATLLGTGVALIPLLAGLAIAAVAGVETRALSVAAVATVGILAVQWLALRAFIARRERFADARAWMSLAPTERTRLLEPIGQVLNAMIMAQSSGATNVGGRVQRFVRLVEQWLMPADNRARGLHRDDPVGEPSRIEIGRLAAGFGCVLGVLALAVNSAGEVVAEFLRRYQWTPGHVDSRIVLIAWGAVPLAAALWFVLLLARQSEGALNWRPWARVGTVLGLAVPLFLSMSATYLTATWSLELLAFGAGNVSPASTLPAAFALSLMCVGVAAVGSFSRLGPEQRHVGATNDMRLRAFLLSTPCGAGVAWLTSRDSDLQSVALLGVFAGLVPLVSLDPLPRAVRLLVPFGTSVAARAPLLALRVLWRDVVLDMRSSGATLRLLSRCLPVSAGLAALPAAIEFAWRWQVAGPPRDPLSKVYLSFALLGFLGLWCGAWSLRELVGRRGDVLHSLARLALPIVLRPEAFGPSAVMRARLVARAAIDGLGLDAASWLVPLGNLRAEGALDAVRTASLGDRLDWIASWRELMRRGLVELLALKPALVEAAAAAALDRAAGLGVPAAQAYALELVRRIGDDELSPDTAHALALLGECDELTRSVAARIVAGRSLLDVERRAGGLASAAALARLARNDLLVQEIRDALPGRSFEAVHGRGNVSLDMIMDVIDAGTAVSAGVDSIAPELAMRVDRILSCA